MSTTTQSTTHQVANKLVEMARKGQIAEIQQELFSDDVVSTEPMGDNPVVKGKAGVIEKSKQFDANVEEVHGSEVSDPLVMGNWFSITWSFDATMKGRGRQKMEEICVYEVKGGKIVSERFFYSM